MEREVCNGSVHVVEWCLGIRRDVLGHFHVIGWEDAGSGADDARPEWMISCFSDSRGRNRHTTNH